MQSRLLATLMALTALPCASFAQTTPASPPAPETQTSSSTNPPPDDPPGGEKHCSTCEEGAAGGSETAACPAGTSETKEVGSVFYTVGVGTTSYNSKNNFLSRQIGKLKPKFLNYPERRKDGIVKFGPSETGPNSVGRSTASSGGASTAMAPQPQKFGISNMGPGSIPSLSHEWGNKLIRPVIIGLVTEELTDASFTPAALALYSGNAGNAWVKRDSAGALRQILTDQYLTDITVPAPGQVQITTYLRETIGTLDPGTGLYGIPAAVRKFRTVLISRPTPGGLDIVDITTSDFSSSQTMPKVRGARWTRTVAGNETNWVLSHHAAAPATMGPFASVEVVVRDLGGGLYERTETTRKPSSTGSMVVHAVTRQKYRDIGSGNYRVVEEVEAPGTPEELTTTYTYTDLTGTGVIGLSGVMEPPQPDGTPNVLIGGRLHTAQRSDGYWEEYRHLYNGGTRIYVMESWSSWKNCAVGDKAHARHTIVTTEEGAVSVVDDIEGQIVSVEKEKLTLAADGTRTLVQETRTGSDTPPQVTERIFYPDTAAEPFKGRIQSIRHPDGTLSRYTYQQVSAGLKTLVESGVADVAQSAPGATGPVPPLTKGRRTETLTNSFNRIIESKTYDIASGFLLDQMLVTAVDDLGRPLHVIHDADVNDYEDYTYACCGVKTHRARDGSVTEYTKDALDRPLFTTTTLGSRTTTFAYHHDTEAVEGRALPRTTVEKKVTAGPNDTGYLLVSQSVNDLRGNLRVERSPDSNGDNQPETTTCVYQPTARRVTTTFPDGITTSGTYYADGQAAQVETTAGGTPIRPTVTYDYTPHSQQGGGILSTAQTSDGTVILSRSSTYSDLAARPFRVEHPGYAGATLVTLVQRDARGRTIGSTNTGEPATLQVLDLEGNAVESWTDSNGDGQFNNTAVNGIRDQVTLQLADYVLHEGQPRHRSRHWIRNDQNEDILLSTTYTGLDGLWSKQVPLSGAVQVSSSTKPLLGGQSGTSRTNLTETTYLETVFSTTLNADGGTTRTTIDKDTNGNTLRVSTARYDLLGRLTEQTGERGLTTTYADFTASGAPLKTTAPDGTVTLTTLDAASRPIRVETRNASSAVIATQDASYHPNGQVKANWGSQTYPTCRIYDLQGHLVELRTYRSHNLGLIPDEHTTGYDATTWNYEPATGLLLSKRDAAGKGADYTYTASGQLLTRTWARGVVTTYQYDRANRLIALDYSDATPDVTLQRDRLGRTTRQINGVATSTFTYDPVKLLLDAETLEYDLDRNGTPELTRVLDRSQDSLGRPGGYQLKDGATIETSSAYTYSATEARLQSIAGAESGNTFTYQYLPNSSLIEKVTGPVHTVTNTWEANRNVLASKQNKAGNVVISQYDYAVNELGQRTNVSQSGSAFTAARSILWGYDVLGQVTSADSSENSHDRAYQYDAIGNRIEARDGVTAVSGTANYTANALNQYTAANGFTPTYDEDGNQLAAQIKPQSSSSLSNCTYEWDAENRLIAIKAANGTTLASYQYDSQSRRIAKSVPGQPAAITIYEGWNPIAEYQASSLNSENCQLRNSYLWGLDLSGGFQGAGGVGGLLAVTAHSSSLISFYPTYDGNGNVSEYLDGAGIYAAHYEYDAFGNVVIATGNQAESFTHRFSTKQQDAESGLYYYGYRYDDPITGRWPSRDPKQEKGGANLYEFAGNDGVNKLDYLGLYDSIKTSFYVHVRPIRYDPKKDDWAVWLSSKTKIPTHAEIDSVDPNEADLAVRSRSQYASPDETYSISIDLNPTRKMDDGSDCRCADLISVEKCLKRNPYSAGSGCWGDNCHTSVYNAIKNCCLKTSYSPPDYGIPYSGRREWGERDPTLPRYVGVDYM